MNTLDDNTLIEKFVKGQVTLLFNRNLRVEPDSGIIQLLTRQGKLLASLIRNGKLKSFLVREESGYWEVINQMLIENYFIPNSLAQEGFIKYEYSPVPSDCKINYTSSVLLWRIWKLKVYQNSNSGVTDIPSFLISTPNGWQPITELEFSLDNLFIKTTINDLVLYAAEKLAWLSPIEQKPVGQVFYEQFFANVNNELSNQPKTTDSTEKGVTPSVLNLANRLPENSSPLNNNILNIYQGKLYIQTIEGEIVVEGQNLKFWFTPPEGHNITPQVLEIPNP
jgi:hypothetical protein